MSMAGTELPRDHAQRFELSDEVHARPPETLAAPLRFSYLALLSDWSARKSEWALVCELAERHGVAPPAEAANHFSADLGAFRLRWERHSEFARYKIIVAGAPEQAFSEPAITVAPASWVAALPGELMVATHGALLRGGEMPPDPDALSERLFDGNVLVGAGIAGGAGRAFTDFRIHDDGFSRLLVQDCSLTPRQAGRMIQRLLEIDTYRVMALLAFPVARQLAPFLNQSERELAQITTALARSGATDEAALLDRLTRLEAAIESRESENHFRFGAAAAYYALVRRRIDELREDRLQGLQTFREFIERRLAPAMDTCLAVSERQESLSQRMSRATQLLSTRVAISSERQNRAVLESMDRRAKLQLRLQQTVEGLSVAAITYYVAGLVGYLAKGAEALGIAVSTDIVVAVSIPLVALVVALGVRKIRKAVTQRERKG